MNPEFKKVLLGAAISASFLSLASCKPANSDSESKSLDNFTAGANSKFVFNSCSGSNAVSVSDSKLLGTSVQRLAIRSALSAVPVELQTAFFDSLKGSIAVVSDIHTACKASKLDSGSRDATLACWQPGDTSATIYIKAEAKDADTLRNIRHSVVRSMGYILTDVILKVKQSSEGTKLVENSAFADVKAALAEALLKDIKGNKALTLPASFTSNREVFAAAAFAESFDSYYCSVNSRTTMSATFSETSKIFAEVAAALPEALRSSTPTVKSAESAEMGLWGRWGGGNGPIRQGLSNWGEFRAQGGGLMNFRRFNDGGGLVFQRPWFNPWRWQ